MFHVVHIFKQPLGKVLQNNRRYKYVTTKTFFRHSPQEMFFSENNFKYAANLK